MFLFTVLAWSFTLALLGVSLIRPRIIWDRLGSASDFINQYYKAFLVAGVGISLVATFFTVRSNSCSYNYERSSCFSSRTQTISSCKATEIHPEVQVFQQQSTTIISSGSKCNQREEVKVRVYVCE